MIAEQPGTCCALENLDLNIFILDRITRIRIIYVNTMTMKVACFTQNIIDIHSLEIWSVLNLVPLVSKMDTTPIQFNNNHNVNLTES